MARGAVSSKSRALIAGVVVMLMSIVTIFKSFEVSRGPMLDASWDEVDHHHLTPAKRPATITIQRDESEETVIDNVNTKVDIEKQDRRLRMEQNNISRTQSHSSESYKLRPTFDGFHDFIADGPRKEPFLNGLNIQELLDLDEKPQPEGETVVNFFKTKYEYYAAAWLATVEAFMENENFYFEADSTLWQKDWNPNLEAGTWAGVKGRMNHRTTDYLNFFVHHLSRYKGGYSVIGRNKKLNWDLYIQTLRNMQVDYDEQPFNNPTMHRNGRVLVICPFHGAADIHSEQDEKMLHLNITIKALARVFPNIVVTVCDEKNLNFVTKHSGINEYLYDTLLVKNLSMAPITQCTHLPILSNIQVRRLLRNEDNEKYSTKYFDWIYYTESDEPPHLTNINAVLRETLHNNRTVVVPHRSYPAALESELDINFASKKARDFMITNRHKVIHHIDDLRDKSCCFLPPLERVEWESPKIQLFKQYNGHAQANGWCNPLRNTCTTCTFRNRTEGPCPGFHQGNQGTASGSDTPAVKKDGAERSSTENIHTRDDIIKSHSSTTRIQITNHSDPRSYELKPTFSDFHDFIADGPRKEPFLNGLNIQELLDLDKKPQPEGETVVNFFKTNYEYYAAAWLATVEAFMENENFYFEADSTLWQKDWNPNLEAGTWAGVKGRMNHRTTDYLNFFVHHLSRYKGGYSVIGRNKKLNWDLYIQTLRNMQVDYDEQPFNNPTMHRNGRVLVICPFHGAADIHSEQDEKMLHLNITIKALARVFPNIVVTVCDEKNLNFVTKHSGINEYLYDTLLVKNLSMAPITQCTHLPILSNIQVRRLLRNEDNEKYSTKYFDWIYYTESDEPPHLTNINAVLRETLHNNRTVVVPHRSYPAALETELDINFASKKARDFMITNRHKVIHHIDDLRDKSCCFLPPLERVEWESPKIQLFKQFNGHAQANGWCNPLRNTCTTCTFRNRTEGPCPAF